MLLRRLGNKQKIAQEIQKHFPTHKIYIEPFFGAGGMFFNKQKVKYNILNDLDGDVFNLFQVVINNKESLLDSLNIMPIDEHLWEYWKKNQETEPIKKALRFILISNFGYMGKPDTLRFNNGNAKKILLENLNKTHLLLENCEFSNSDFRKLFKKIPFRTEDKEQTFIYADPPYLNKTDNYSNSFTEQDASDLFDTLQNTNIKFAYSEFNHPYIIDQAQKRKLNINIIGERQSMKNRNTQILITNYQQELKLF